VRILVWNTNEISGGYHRIMVRSFSGLHPLITGYLDPHRDVTCSLLTAGMIAFSVGYDAFVERRGRAPISIAGVPPRPLQNYSCNTNSKRLILRPWPVSSGLVSCSQELSLSFVSYQRITPETRREWNNDSGLLEEMPLQYYSCNIYLTPFVFYRRVQHLLSGRRLPPFMSA
jgi:hypothetical protein